MKQQRKVRYYLQDDGKFIIDNYDLAKPFASFFPGIAGLYGIPMWVFYVNRGQGIASFGTKNKNQAILAFQPANRAWQMVPARGFRTFIKIRDSNKDICYEPFQNTMHSRQYDLQRKMMISSFDFSLHERNHSLSLDIDVNYFTLSNEPLACLIRTLKIKNTSTQKKDIEILDGLPQVIPYGLSDRFLKDLGRTMEAWMQVQFVGPSRVPFYKLSVDPTDRPQVMHIEGGNFYYSFCEHQARRNPCKIIVDPKQVFGPITSFNYPACFHPEDFSIPEYQAVCSKTPCAFSHCRIHLAPKAELTLVSLIGSAQDKQHLGRFIKKIKQKSYLSQKCEDYKTMIEKLQGNIFTASSNNPFNCYCQQTYLDNVLRGGFPLTLKSKNISHTFHVYSRKHGDLERDYNNFLTNPTYFSQGNGNYRDVNQNRRSDVWFNPALGASNVIAFFNLLQLDGFNPLVVFGALFKLRKDQNTNKIAALFVKKKHYQKMLDFIKKKFTVGDLLMYLEEHSIRLKVERGKFLQEVLSYCEKHLRAEHGDGFWIDHWTYNIDALESYLAIYPENLKNLLLNNKRFVFFDNFVKIKPRDEKYVLFNGNVRQYHAVTLEEIQEDSKLSREIIRAHWAVHTKHGQGPMYRTTLLVKILCLIANKMASFDSSGRGIEMEANKPGWYDALNGLPGLFGSSSCEVMELKRIIVFLKKALVDLKIKQDYKIIIAEEIYDFITDLKKLTDVYSRSKQPNRDFIFWQKASTLKESYRRKIKDGLHGREKKLTVAALMDILQVMERKTERAIGRSKDKKTGLYHTYYINEVVDYEKIKIKGGYKIVGDGLYCVRAKKIRQKPLPLFLEAQVHALRIEDNKLRAKKIFINTKKSQLYDKALKMYKVNASLDKMSADIGRARIFTPGWLENESIWLHMEYKFILELLRQGLYDEFFDNFKHVLIPFQPPLRYGRSITENSSFLVSSAYPDKSLHGNGFVARLSGSTAEFINIWLWINAGKTPFRQDKKGKLYLEFNPILPGWLFFRKSSLCDYYLKNGEKVNLELPKNSYAFNFLGTMLIVYHNPKLKDTFGRNRVRPKRIRLYEQGGKVIQIDGPIIPSPLAGRIRAGEFVRADIDLDD